MLRNLLNLSTGVFLNNAPILLYQQSSKKIRSNVHEECGGSGGGRWEVMKGFCRPELSAHARWETALGKGTCTVLAATLQFKNVTRTLKHVKSSVAPAGGIADSVAVV